MVTDIPHACCALREGISDGKIQANGTKLRSWSVFSKEDLLPSLVELALVPYLVYKADF